MINTFDISSTVSKLLKKNIKGISIYFDEDELQTRQDDKACLYVNTTLISSDIATLNTNVENVIIDISYYAQYLASKKDIYGMENMLRSIFLRSLKVKDNYIHLNSFNSTIVRDDIGYRLNFSMSSKYHNLMFDKSTYKNNKVVGTEKTEIFDDFDMMGEIIID